MQIRENLNTSELTKSPYSLQTEFSRCTKITNRNIFFWTFWTFAKGLLPAPTQASKVLIKSLWVTMAIEPSVEIQSREEKKIQKQGGEAFCWLCFALPPLYIDHNAYFSVQFDCTLNTAHMHCDAFEYIACCAVCTLPTASCIQCLLCSLQCTCNNI